MTVTFSIPGDPQGKARARVVRTKTGRSISYTPDKTAAYEKLACQCYQNQVGGWKFPPDCPLRVEITAFFSIPKSKSKREKEQMREGELLPIKKPDADNITKIICDALNGVAYADDKQITSLTIDKVYSLEPKVIVEIEEVKTGENIRGTDRACQAGGIPGQADGNRKKHH